MLEFLYGSYTNHDFIYSWNLDMQHKEKGAKFWLLIIVIGVMALLSLNTNAEEKCPYDGVNLTDDPELLKKILNDHLDWKYKIPGKDDPQRANLCRANLAAANLLGADLRGVDLSGAVLSGANLREANLRHADLSGNDLIGANLRDADLSGAKLEGANLTWAKLEGANLYDAKLVKAVLIQARLEGADLTRAVLRGADLTRADLSGADLSGAKLVGADLTRARLFSASVTGATFYPKPLTEVTGLRGISGLSKIIVVEVMPLVTLRNQFKDAGFKSEEKALTSALRRHELKKASQVERFFAFYVMGGAITDFGANPSLAIIALFSLIPVFWVFYLVALWIPGKDGIWQRWLTDRIRTDLGDDQPVLLKKRGLVGFGYALYFSLLSAFHIGWRDLNVGSWISRIQPREYTLSGSGWVRTVSGIQSLISVYLLAIAVLSYFGRPFE